MSHAANLRRQQASQVALSAKRRRSLSDTGRPKLNGSNGLINGYSAATRLTATPTHDAKRPKRVHFDQPKVVVRQGDVDVDGIERGKEEVDVSHEDLESQSGDGSEGSRDDVQDSSTVQNERGNKQQKLANGNLEVRTAQKLSQDGPTQAGVAEAVEQEEPTFGDLLRAGISEPVTVEVSSSEQRLLPISSAPMTNDRPLTVPSANSLGTVLTQALRTNDVELLESCLQVSNLQSIRATIERLHSSLAASLLQKLAERMHKRPGRAGSLMVWVQWTVVAHGGYLASQPAAMKQLHTLYQVVKQRAACLQPLLALKGKLDMLEAQMQLRRNMQARSRGAANHDEDDEGVIYVEGEEQSSSDEEADSTNPPDQARSRVRRRNHGRKTSPEPPDPLFVGDGEEDAGHALMNSVEVSEDEDSSADTDDDKLIDDEAEESDGDSDMFSDEEIDYEDADLEENQMSDSEAEDLAE